MKEFSALKKEVISLSKEIGRFLLREFHQFNRSNIEFKGFNDLVSYVDKESEKKIVDRLQQLLPEAGFITEEGTIDKKSDALNWVIDPLDGTTNFMHQLPVYGVSLALMEREQVKLGVIYDPNRDECFHAVAGGKAFCNEEMIKVSPVLTLAESLISTGFPYFDFEKLRKYMGMFTDFMQKTHGLRRMGSAAIDLSYVACGRFEGFFEYNINSWDVAAGALIVQEAGGTVTDFSGGDDYIFGREIIAASGVHQEMLPIIKETWNSQNL